MSLIKTIKLDGGGILGIWKFTESCDELLASLADRSAYEKELERMSSPSRRLEYLATRVLLKTMIGKELHVAHYASGKPFIKEGGYHISISHTKGFAAVALSKNTPVGVDIEYFADRVKRIVGRFVSEQESAFVNAFSGIPYIYMLLLLWSAKETVYKMMDCEEVDFLRHIRVNAFALSGKGAFTVGETRTENKVTYPMNYLLNNDFVCTWTEGVPCW